MWYNYFISTALVNSIYSSSTRHTYSIRFSAERDNVSFFDINCISATVKICNNYCCHEEAKILSSISLIRLNFQKRKLKSVPSFVTHFLVSLSSCWLRGSLLEPLFQVPAKLCNFSLETSTPRAVREQKSTYETKKPYALPCENPHCRSCPQKQNSAGFTASLHYRWEKKKVGEG